LETAPNDCLTLFVAGERVVSHRHLEPSRIAKTIWVLLLICIVSAAIHFPYQESVYVRGPFGALGLMCSWFAAGIALWSFLRLRESRLLRAFVVSLFVLAYWTWQLYEAVIGRYH
jgi:hypothetical protein